MSMVLLRVRCWHAGGVRTILTEPPRTALSWKLLPALLLSASGVLLFGVGHDPAGYGLLALGLITAAIIDRALARHLALIAVGLAIISLVPLNADLSIQHMILMGGALGLAVLVPWLASRFAYREEIIKFPVNTGRKWPLAAKLYLIGVVALGYLILPVYLISTGVYQNWPDASDPIIFWRLFLGVNAVGIWDELFFICTTFTLLRRHFPDWLANILQAVIFSSFLWEIGYQAWGPLLTFPFALLQGYTFKLTKSLTYVVTVHLIFDFVLFLVLVHAHNRDWLAVFLY
jgi:membrane protease YdiL (CAAX protease family)